MSESDGEAAHKINQLYWGFVISRAIHVAAKLGLADHFKKDGTTSNEVAETLSLNSDRLYRLMRLLASYDIFTETDKGSFKPTALSNAIKTDTNGSVRDAAHLVTRSMWEAYGHLEYSIRTGGDTYTDLFGKGVFDYLDENPEESDEFDNAMHNYAELENPVIAAACPLNNAKTIVDVGGGQGGFLKEILHVNSEIKATLFDQPHVISDAIFPIGDPALDDRLMKVGGSFFEHIPGGSDVYVMKRILHDWSDDDCCKILETVRTAMTASSRLFVIDAIVPGGNTPHFSKDLEAFLMTWGGQERDKGEFEALFNRVNMKLTSVTETQSLLSIIEAKIA